MATNKRNPSIVPADYSSGFNPFVFAEVPEKSLVLDVGCWNGNLGKALIKEKHCTVEGVDFEKNVLKDAEKNGYRRAYVIDLNVNPKELEKINSKYDMIVCADILEHLIDPQTVLTLLTKLLNKDGKILISLPNAAFGLNRWNLLRGRWDYTEFGTLDKTHLRFFTARTLKDLVTNSGLKIEKFKPYNQFGILKRLSPLDQLWPEFLCYQFIIIGGK